MGQFAQGHAGSKGSLRLSRPYPNHVARSPFPGFALCLQDAVLLPNPPAALSSSSYSAEGHGGDCEYPVVVGTGHALAGKEGCVAAVAESKLLCAMSLTGLSCPL